MCALVIGNAVPGVMIAGGMLAARLFSGRRLLAGLSTGFMLSAVVGVRDIAVGGIVMTAEQRAMDRRRADADDHGREEQTGSPSVKGGAVPIVTETPAE